MRVLIAVEDEQYSAAAVAFLAGHQWGPGTLFKVLNAVEPAVVGDRITATYGNDLQNEIIKDRVECGQHLVAQAKVALMEKFGLGIPIETNVIIGHPHQTILSVAEDWKADMLVMGSHGRKGFSKLILGSVSQSVLSQAPCSVIIVRLPQCEKRQAAGCCESNNKASKCQTARTDATRERVHQ